MVHGNNVSINKLTPWSPNVRAGRFAECPGNYPNQRRPFHSRRERALRASCRRLHRRVPADTEGRRTMIGLGKAALKIYVALEPCDMRKSLNGLSAAASQQLGDGRLGTDMLFVFINKRKDRIKLLYFDGAGHHVPGCGSRQSAWRKSPSVGRRRSRGRPNFACGPRHCSCSSTVSICGVRHFDHGLKARNPEQNRSQRDCGLAI